VDVDYGTKTAIVDVPDECYPPAPVGKPETITNDAKAGPVITTVSLEQTIDSAQFFGKRYVNGAAKFALEVK